MSVDTMSHHNELTPKQLYLDTIHGNINTTQLQQYLQQQIDSLPHNHDIHVDMPDTYNSKTLYNTLIGAYKSVLQRYDMYLKRRANGGPREMFINKSHALYYIEQIQATKLVDGSWLYSTLTNQHNSQYNDILAILRKIYIEECGEGEATMNHVAIYKQLLHKYNLNTDLQQYDNILFTQGAIQLALGYCGVDYLPEVIGYNLAYEQLPYHLLVETYELDELGIDNYYFQLHVTIDNTSTGHSKQAIDSVVCMLDKYNNNVEQQNEIYQRIRNGMLLGELGISCNQIVQNFNYKTELYKSIANKSNIAYGIHMKAVKIGQYTLNEWLDPVKCQDLHHIAQLFQSMIDSGYIQQGKPAECSKFWQYASSSNNGVMYGVFNQKEKELIKLFIEDSSHTDSHPETVEAMSTTVNKQEQQIESLIDKYLGTSLKQHKHISLPDPDTHQYVPLNELYTHKRSKLLQSMSRYTVRKGMHDSFCFGKMQRVMPEADKQALLNWLGIFNNKLDEDVTRDTDIDREQQYIDTMVITHRLINKTQENIFINTLMTVLSRYITPLNHYTNRGIFVTAIYNTVLNNTLSSAADSELYEELQQYNYWILVSLALQFIQHTLLDSTVDVQQLIDSHITTQSDRDTLHKTLQHTTRHLIFDNQSPVSSPRKIQRSIQSPASKTYSIIYDNTTGSKQQQNIYNWLKFVIPLFTVLLITPLVRATFSQ